MFSSPQASVRFYYVKNVFTGKLTELYPLRYPIDDGSVDVLKPYPGFGGDRYECIAVLFTFRKLK